MKLVSSELEKLRVLLGTLPSRRPLPANSSRPTKRALDRILQHWDVIAQPPQDRLRSARLAIVQAQRDGTDLATLPPALIRDGIFLLWPSADDDLDRKSLLAAILAKIGTNTGMLRRMIDVWLMTFDSDDETFIHVGRQLDRHLAASQAGLLARWKEAHRSYDIFNATKGPELMAARLLEDVSATVLSAYRLDTPARAASGYLRAVHLAISKRLPQLLREDRALEHFDRAGSFFVTEGRLRFDEPQPNGAMADGLVGAWIRARRQPSDRLREKVLTYLRQHLGDPRVERNRWVGSSEETRQTVRTWLSALSLDAFFDVVGRFAGNAGMGQQWAARKAFWSACLKAGHIRDSWLVLGDNVARSVSDNVNLHGSFGQLRDSDPNRSVLLIQIGDLVFSEWTYNGKLRAWSAGAKTAPKLFRARYDREEITGDGLQFPPPLERPHLKISGADGITHYKGEEVWQGRTAALLQRKEGIVLQPRDWRVR